MLKEISSIALEDVLHDGAAMNLPPEEIAAGVQKWHDLSNEWADGQTTKKDRKTGILKLDDDKYWKGAQKLDEVTSTAMAGLQSAARDQWLLANIPDAATQQDFLKVYSESNGAPEMYANEAADFNAKVVHNPAFQLPAVSEATTPIYSGSVEVGSYTPRRTKAGIEAMVYIPDANGKTSRARLKIPHVSDAEVAAETAQADHDYTQILNTQAEMYGAIEGMQYEYVRQPFEQVERLASEREQRLNTLKDPEAGRQLLMNERINAAVKGSKLADKVGTGFWSGAAEDMQRGLYKFVNSSRIGFNDVTGDTEERDQLRSQQDLAEQAMPGATGARFRGGIPAFASEFMDMAGNAAPTVLTGLATGGLPAEASFLAKGVARLAPIASMVPSLYGNAAGEMLNHADELDGKAEAARQRGSFDLANSLQAQAQSARDSHQSYAAATTAAFIIPQFISKDNELFLKGQGSMPSRIRKAALAGAKEMGTIAAVQGQVIDPAFGKERGGLGDIAYQAAMGGALSSVNPVFAAGWKKAFGEKPATTGSAAGPASEDVTTGRGMPEETTTPTDPGSSPGAAPVPEVKLAPPLAKPEGMGVHVDVPRTPEETAKLQALTPPTEQDPHGTVPESSATLLEQRQRVSTGKFNAMILPGMKAADVPAEFLPKEGEPVAVVDTPAGAVIHKVPDNPADLQAVQDNIVQAAKENRLGEVLGYGVPDKPENADRTVVLRRADGVEVRAVTATAETEPQVRAALKANMQDGDVVITETLDQTLQGRQEAAPPVSPMAPPSPEATSTPEAPGTSVKNAKVDEERAARGLPPLMSAARQSWGAAWDQAMANVEAHPEAGRDLVQELNVKPRAISDVENALILHTKISKRAAAAAAMEAVNHAPSDAARAEAQTKLSSLLDDLNDIDTAGRRAGTELGRGLNARKMMRDEDTSLEHLLTQYRASKDGQPLAPEDIAKVQAIHQKITIAKAKLDAHEDSVQNHEANEAVQRMVSDLNKEAKAATKQNASSKLTDYFDQKAQEARERLKAKGGNLNSGLDPTVLIDHAIIGASYLAKGVVKFGSWSTEMLKEFGENVRPHLQSIFAKAQEMNQETARKIIDDTKAAAAAAQPAAIVARAKDAIASGDIPNTLDPTIARALALAHVRSGVKDVGDLISKLHSDLEKLHPNVTERDVRDAISGYGKTSQPSPDEARKTLSDLSTQSRLLSALEDATNGKPPLRTGFQRGKPSDKVRELTRKVTDMMRQNNITVSEPGQQLANSLQQVKTRLQNRIRDLTKQIETGTKTAKRVGIPLDAEAEALRTEANRLRAVVQEMEGPTVVSPEQRIKVATSALERSIADYTKRIKEGDISPRQGPATAAWSKDISALRAQRAKLQESLQELKDAANPKLTPEQVALKTLKTRMASQMALLKDRMARGDFSKKTPRVVALDNEAIKLKGEYERTKLDWRRAVEANRSANRPGWVKKMDALVKWRRFALLTGIPTLVKLSSAASYRVLLAPVEEAIGGALSKALPQVAAKAPREGGFSSAAEARAITEGLRSAINSFGDVLKSGKSNLDMLYGKPEFGDLTKSWFDWAGQIHAALKSPAKQNEFYRSFQKRAEYAIREGLDPHEPGLQMKLGQQAYQDANRAIFMQDNFMTDGYKAVLNYWERSTKYPTIGPAAAKAARILLPIIKVPTNIVGEATNLAIGLPRGAIEYGLAVRKGMDQLPPEQADAIMRHLKKGSIGAAMILLGFFNPSNIGGFYQKREKRDPEDVKAGSMRLFGVEIPHALTHAPIFEALQFGATMSRVSEALDKESQRPKGIVDGTWAAGLGLLEEVPFITGGGSAYGALQLDGSGKYKRGEMVKSFVIPIGVSQIAGYLDRSEGKPVKRQTDSVVDHILSGIPGLRQTLPVRE